MEILLAGTMVVVILTVGWVGIIWGIMLPSKSDKEELLKLQDRVSEIQLLVKYLETKEDGEHLAYRLGRAMGMTTDEAEQSVKYTRECLIVLGSPEDTPVLKQMYSQTFTIEEAKAKLNELIAKKHDEDCLQLSKEEEKLILNRRQKDWDSRWVEVKPRRKKK